MQRKFVIGDIHGHFNALEEVLDIVKFDFANDILISLGDLVDRGDKPIETVELLMKIKNLIFILGNHDDYCLKFLKNNKIPEDWEFLGGETTILAYNNSPEYKVRHFSFFENAKLFFIDEEKRLFVHGGYNPDFEFYKQINNKDVFLWNRSLISRAAELSKKNQTFIEFTEIFVGHTPTLLIGESMPLHLANLWLMDTGVHVKGGRLSIMNVQNKEFYQSSPTV